MAVTYRRLGPDDAGVLNGTAAFDNPVDPVQAGAFLAHPDHEIVVAIDEGVVIGFASGAELLHPDKPPSFFIAEVGVDETHQRRGIAAELVERLVSVARERGCQGVWVATEEDNEAARALYRRVGARETGGVVVYDWDGAMDA